MKIRPRAFGLLFAQVAIGVVLQLARPQWPWGNGDHDQVPGRDLPGRGVSVHCTSCGYVTRIKRWKYSSAPRCPKCRKGKLQRTG
jgi:hypothetical protein